MNRYNIDLAIQAAKELERLAAMHREQQDDHHMDIIPYYTHNVNYHVRELYFSELVDLERQLFVNPEAEHSMSVDADGGLMIKIAIK